ncbi:MULTISPECIES: proline racemase family protein [Bacillus cereus group]|uniref:Proline racemase n=1 Tax=Bacillus thuringiensis TaxID=1428 RepID=A0A1C4EIU1_BACTU|nr:MULTISPECIES: proline racemase family protein [Bacillus cereus group]MCC2327287.1 proline racemase family protein [Bacillus wiedmannii]MDP1456421.1 proline racemase family protein [Bacillus wiedmannii]MED3024348.1 proline racemase family protein [Bacillus wiedmannii]OTY03014.1 proline racemase [Bacillus thuringiensis serovar wratislaviensis]OUB61445.1 proline racemase [Bacillus thuringiensis serovar sylvestriensis]
MNIQKMYTAVDVHVNGEAFRVMKDVPCKYYSSLEQLNEQFSGELAEEMKLLLNEPRGFIGLNGCIVVPSIHTEVDAAVLFFNHEGSIPLHYGGIVAVITMLLESGYLKKRETNQYKIETLSGIFVVHAYVENDEVVSVSFESKLCYVIEQNLQTDNISYSLIQADKVYAVVEKDTYSPEIRIENISELKKWGEATLQTIQKQSLIKRLILVDSSQKEKNHIKSITFHEDNFIVRSPGFVSTIVSYVHTLFKNDYIADKPFKNESIFNSFITVEQVKKEEQGYIFRFESRGFITGMQTFLLDPTDPFPTGFLLK